MNLPPFLSSRSILWAAALAALAVSTGGHGKAGPGSPEPVAPPRSTRSPQGGDDPVKLVSRPIAFAFGSAVAVSGDRAAVGSPFAGAESSGAAYLFERDAGGPGNWGQVAEVTPSDPERNDGAGGAVALDGDRLVVGAEHDDALQSFDVGSAYIFERNAGGSDNWGQVVKLVAADGQNGDSFGSAVATDRDRVIVGAIGPSGGGEADAGAAYLFERNAGGPGEWGQVAKLVADDRAGLAHFGASVAIDGDTIVVGAPGHYAPDDPGDRFRAGAVFIFERVAGSPDIWLQAAVLTAPDPQPRDFFGGHVALAGDTVVVSFGHRFFGRPPHDSNLHVFERDADDPQRWLLAATISGVESLTKDVGAVAIQGDLLVAGADDDDAERGSAAIFARDAGGPSAWGQVARLTVPDAELGDQLGTAVAISGTRVLAGSPGDAAAYVYDVKTFGPFLRVSGACPGHVRIEISGARPERQVTLGGSFAEGSFVLPGGPCAGTELGLDRPVLLGTATSDELGNVALELDLGEGPCGAYLQALAPSSCRPSNVARLPQRRSVLRYDPGRPADFFRRSADHDDTYAGNVFDTALGSPLAGGSLSAVQVYLRRGYCLYENTGEYYDPHKTLAVFSYPASPDGRVYALENLHVPVVPYVRDSTFRTYVLANPISVPARFMLGHFLFYPGINPYYGDFCVSGLDLGMRSGTLSGQAHHAFALDRLGDGVGTNLRRLDANAMIRARGGFGAPALPVELMNPAPE